MKELSTRVIDRLAQRRLRTNRIRAAVVGGERGSRSAGAGIEFTEHRPYQPGDDLRHLDHNVYARTRAPYVKRFSADRGLAVSLLLDKSDSMAYGIPRKDVAAMSLASGIACAALAGGDRLQAGTFGGGGRVVWQRPATGMAHLQDVVTDLYREVPSGTTDLASVARTSQDRLSAPGVTVIVSDWWSEAPETVVRNLGRLGQEVIVVHVLSPQEEEPLDGEGGTVRLQDVETGTNLELNVDAGVAAAYVTELARWKSTLRRAVDDVQGRYLPVRTDENVEQVLLQRWLDMGFIV